MVYDLVLMIGKNQGDGQQKHYRENLSKRKVGPCWACSVVVKANSVLLVQ